MQRVLVTGAGGRMGREVVRAVSAAPDLELVAQVGSQDNLEDALTESKPDVMVEFTLPHAVMANCRAALRLGVIPLIGTTGLTTTDFTELGSLCAQHNTAALFAPNFAIGAVLLMRFSAEAAKYLPDVEIIEMHHERKVDAPSGTALYTAECIAEARREANSEPSPPPPHAFEAISGARGGRTEGGVPIHSVRLPGFVASQEVLFGGSGQRLSLRHDSIDRVSFMPGVLLAIRRSHQLRGFAVGLEKLL